jgi:hypothetical protein
MEKHPRLSELSQRVSRNRAGSIKISTKTGRALLEYGAPMRVLVGVVLLFCGCASRQIGPDDQGHVVDLAGCGAAGASCSDDASCCSGSCIDRSANGVGQCSVLADGDMTLAYSDMANVPHVCNSTCSTCPGPCCGNACCQPGEWCDTATSTCHCGTGPACYESYICVGGPIGGCGTMCQPTLH